MAIVHLPSGWTQHTNGLADIMIDAARVQDLLLALVERYPSLAGPLEQAAIAINGKIYDDARYERVEPNSDVHLLPPVASG